MRTSQLFHFTMKVSKLKELLDLLVENSIRNRLDKLNGDKRLSASDGY